MRLREFAPAGGDDREPNEEEILRQLAAQWWQGDEDPRAERTLASMGWEIGQDEGYDNGGAFVVRAGDVNGNSFISWPAEELEDLEEGWKTALGGAALAGAMALGGGAANAKMTAPGMQAPAAATAQSTASAPLRPTTLKQQASPVEQLKSVAMASGIKGVELAQFLAQCAHESANFASMEERGTSAYFTKKYEKNTRKARILGNKVKGDGERYKGRGYIQLTGRDNYTRAGEALGLPLAQNPNLAASPDIAAKVAVWYWQNRVAPKIKDFSDTGAVTKKINSASNGLQSRQDQFKSYQVAMR
jgi:putative chitinase